MQGPLGQQVTLLEVLEARETRVDVQRALLGRKKGAALVSLTVNMPGPVKRTAESVAVFRAGFCAAANALHRAGTSPALYFTRQAVTGDEGYLLLFAPAEDVKRTLVRLESTLSYGRLIDADVLRSDGTQVSRTALGLPARGCMVCSREGAYCASRRLHPLDELTAAFSRLAAGVREAEP